MQKRWNRGRWQYDSRHDGTRRMLAICCVSWTPSCLLCRIGLVEAWSGRPQDRAVLELIADTVDRRVDLAAECAAAEDTTRRVKLSAELRLLEGSLARLLRMVSTDVPTPESQTRSSEQVGGQQLGTLDHAHGADRRPAMAGRQ